ncbi:hypothetical protein DPMN_042537 [Dreissena polymorpha]|uniref:Uncharacterized protein n=1 Tax=Dreissena polymorpha TaxID=45954 RepID=A0A9D4CYS6_DREPO|nr:hypothetical protein DPMN_042537 [Dreissena polymorpha]
MGKTVQLQRAGIIDYWENCATARNGDHWQSVKLGNCKGRGSSAIGKTVQLKGMGIIGNQSNWATERGGDHWQLVHLCNCKGRVS